jgi:predicted flap endonuclease-1-like 5' DNA nuclease
MIAAMRFLRQNRASWSHVEERSLTMNYSSKPILRAAAALLFAVCALEAQGQVDRNAERTSRERMATDAAESEDREMMLALTERYHKSGEKREPRLAFAQIREDFVRLQVINNDLAQAVSGGGQLDFKLVAKSASEIKKRAERLKLNLALPEPPADNKPPAAADPADPEQLRVALKRLDGIVLRFTNALHEKGVRRFDAQSSTRLRIDLEAIIGLSGRVKKSSERLSEAAR